MSEPTAQHPHQSSVDAMALAISKAELRTQQLLAENIGTLHAAIRHFAQSCDIHPSLLAEAHAAVGEADALVAGALSRLKDAHDALEKVRCDRDLPVPTPQGGGGGK